MESRRRLQSKARKNGNAPIEVQLTVNGSRCFFSTGKQIHPEKWDKVKQQVKGKDEKSKSLNCLLKSIRTKLYEKEAELLENGFVVTADLLRDAYFDKVESLKEKTIFEVFTKHNSGQERLVGKSLSKATHWISVYTFRLLKEYVQKKYKREDLYLRELNLSFIQDFHTFLRVDKGMAQNSSTKHLKLLKKLINLSIANSYMNFNPFITYKIEREPVEIDFLDEEELRKVINFDTPLPRLERAKDMFLFGCFTGLSYIDIKTLAQAKLPIPIFAYKRAFSLI